MRYFVYPLLFSLLTGVSVVGVAVACPAVSGIPDFNCDGESRIVFIGDSLVFGFGDVTNDNKGGYVLRVAKKLPDSEIYNGGVLGMRTPQLLKLLRNTFDRGRNQPLLDALTTADYVVLDVGRNDRWFFGEPIAALRNLEKATDKITSEVKELTGASPLVIKAVMMLPNRGSQGPWMAELNSLIRKSSRAAAPANLRFDLVSKRLLSIDQIHPTPKGYAALADAFLDYLEDDLPRIVKTQRPDTDGDGIYDLFESIRYGTSPSLADTDGDGRTDGDEVFRTKSNPLVVD